MDEEKAIANLKCYIEQNLYYNKTYTPKTDFEKYCYEHCNNISIILNMLKQKDEEIQELKEKNEARTWTVKKVIKEYIPDYELDNLVERYKSYDFIPRVEIEKILEDRRN